MQLILSFEVNTGIKEKTSSIKMEQINGDEKETDSAHVDKVLSDTTNVKKEITDKQIEMISCSNEIDIKNGLNGIVLNYNECLETFKEEKRQIVNFEEVKDADMEELNDTVSEKENTLTENNIENQTDDDHSIVECDSKEDVQANVSSETNNDDVSADDEDVEDMHTEDFETDLIRNIMPENMEDDNYSISTDDQNEQIKNRNNEMTASPATTAEIIDIADEKDSCDSIEDKQSDEIICLESANVEKCTSDKNFDATKPLENDYKNVEATNSEEIICVEKDNTEKVSSENCTDTIPTLIDDTKIDNDKNSNEIMCLEKDNPEKLSSRRCSDTITTLINDINSNNGVEKYTAIEIDQEPTEISSAETDDCNSGAEHTVPKIDTPGTTDYKKTNNVKLSEPKRKYSLISNLSNTLDILSDEEDDDTTSKAESPKPIPEPLDKESSNTQDDEVIMLVDEESITRENKIVTESEIDKCNKDVKTINDVIENDESKQNTKHNLLDKDFAKDIISKNNDLGAAEPTSNQEHKDKVEDIKEKTQKCTRLLSPDFLKAFKKNLAEVTREELEEFCVLKIVESVFDKSNLGEIKSKLKVMAKKIEEYKTEAKMLSKQNRDLHVVLKSVQEEQKKRSNVPISPLKITRSVGMQVLMTDKNSRKRQQPVNNPMFQNPNINTQNPNNTINRNQQKGIINQNVQNQKPAPQIPVPRLVPAANVKPSPSTSPQIGSNNSKSPVVNNASNAMKNMSPSAPVKPEKRTLNKMQQNNAITVDLTDDEPPSKVMARANNAPVRCVPPQILLAPQRPMGPAINSPRKVFIPISGAQSQNIRPGQTITLKSVPSPGPRQKLVTSPNLKLAPSPNTIRMNNRVTHRHPAPLIDPVKQYQPPNWKAIPPAPELKLAKVENGIVISWKIDGYREENYEEIASYQLYAYQETSSPPSTSLWKKIGDVKALPLPMACTLTQFRPGHKYYFAVRAVDIRSRFGPFSLPGSILLLNKV